MEKGHGRIASSLKLRQLAGKRKMVAFTGGTFLRSRQVFVLGSTCGYTLFELLVVLAILAVMTTVAAWGVHSLVPDMRLRAAVRSLKTDMQMARMAAIKENSNIVTEFSTDRNSYTIYVDDGAGDGNHAHNYSRDAGETTLRTVQLRPRINLIDAKFGAVAGKFAFNSRGAIDGLPGRIYLRNEKKTYLGVTVSRIGKLTIKSSTDGRTWLRLN